MKKSILITAFSILIFSFTSKAQQCVSCYNNDVEFTKNASAVGQNNIASGQASFAMGNAALALGATSGAFGSFSEARAGDCFTFGSKIKATATSAFILGRGCKFTPDYLINNNPYTLMIGFNSTVPTFFISQSPSNSSVNNRTGMVGIGNVTAPEAKLHIKADENENAELYLQSHEWSSASIASIFIGNKNYGVKANGRLGLVFNSENNYVFGNGNVGIGTTDPLHRLHVNGNIMLSSNQSSILFAADTKGEWGEWGIEYQNGGLNFWKPWGSNNFGNYFLFLSDKGNVGIGTETPQEKLDVKGTILTNGFKMPQLGIKDGYVLTADRSGNSKWMPSQNLWQLDKYNNIYYLGGNVGIGTSEPDERLHVNGKVVIGGQNLIRPDGYKLYVEEGILTEKVKVELVTNWADFVFDKNYKLPSIYEVEKFIKENKHLPDIPSAKEVKENGIDLGEMDAKLLQKIEELTLYIIEQQKQLEELRSQVEKLNK